jgi:GH25 family lysozyme M1 (1,4-beta-N-acetylmuramidase)
VLDLSNNNATGHNFKAAHTKGGQLRIYLKAVEGMGFIDKTYPALRTAALKVGMRVGAYDFLHPGEATPAQAASYLLARLPKTLVPGRDLRPCLDCEHGTPTPAIGRWIVQTAAIVAKRTGVKPLIYGSGWWLEACQFKAAPGPLWLAAYGRNDGKEYPIGKLPKPWKAMAAHQFTSTAHVIGINGPVDLSKVFVPASIEIPRSKL